ncbi:MAG: hypothetical protein VB086_00830 [Clostridiaceae bacterium]|nr:hypothetical protein [Clostridiaceae bacterium]
MQNSQPVIRWKVSLSVFQNTVILRQLALALGIPFGLLALILALTTGKAVLGLYILGILAVLLALTWLLFWVANRGKYDMEFVLDGNGALCRTQAMQAKRNRMLNLLTVFLGLFSGSLSATGAGMLAQSRQEVFIRWDRVKKVRWEPRCFTIRLWGSFAEQAALFCTRENYLVIQQFVSEKAVSVRPGGNARRPEA